MPEEVSTCPGCGLVMPRSGRDYDRKFNASAECWSLFEEVIGAEFQNAVLFGQVHQMTVDTYAVQHAGGRHPDKSVCIHLVGMYLAQERHLRLAEIPPRMQRIAGRAAWPHLDPPPDRASLTIRDVAQAGSPEEHARRVRQWADQVWHAWSRYHGVARGLAGDPA